MASTWQRLRLVLVGLAISGGVRAGDPPDGIYLVHEKGDGPKVIRNDTGDTLILGKRLTDKFGTATIRSTSNDNTRFVLDLRGAGPLPKDAATGSKAALIAGRCLMIYSNSDPEADGTMNLGSVIHGDEALRATAQALKVEPRLRQHPGHKLLVTWEPDKPSHRVGEPVGVTVKIKNVGDVTVSFMNGGRQRGPRDNQFGFTAYRGGGAGKAVPDTGDPLNFGGIGGLVTLEPGKEFAKAVVLDKWFKFTEPDTYQITGTFYLKMHEPNETSHWTAWEEYVTGVCQVRIVGPAKETKTTEK